MVYIRFLSNSLSSPPNVSLLTCLHLSIPYHSILTHLFCLCLHPNVSSMHGMKPLIQIHSQFFCICELTRPLSAPCLSKQVYTHSEWMITVHKICAVLLTCVCFSVICVHDRCTICARHDAILCNPCHMLHLSKLFPPTQLSVGSSHSRLPYSSSPSMNRPWDKPPTVQNVFLSYVLDELIIIVRGLCVRACLFVSGKRSIPDKFGYKGSIKYHSILFQPMALPQ